MLSRTPKPELDADMVGIAALTFLANDPELLGRFLDVTGMRADELRAAAERPSFFVGVLDFVLAHEPTVIAFAEHASLQPEQVGEARERLASLRERSRNNSGEPDRLTV